MNASMIARKVTRRMHTGAIIEVICRNFNLPVKKLALQEKKI